MKQSMQALVPVMLVAMGSAQAHVVLENRQAPAGSLYKASLLLGHGCDGSPTRQVVVDVPAGLKLVKPMPQPGWTVQTVKVPLAQPYTFHGVTYKEEVTQVRWEGGSLDDAHVDGFAVVGLLPMQAGTLYWKVTQVCDKGRLEWTQVPAPGQNPANLPTPAVPLDVTAPTQGGHGATGHKH